MTTENAKLAAAARLIELEAELKKAKAALYAAKKSEMVPQVENMRKTDKGQLSIYFNVQRWPVTMGREQLLALFSDENVAKVREIANTLPTYQQRKDAGLTNRNDG